MDDVNTKTGTFIIRIDSWLYFQSLKKIYWILTLHELSIRMVLVNLSIKRKKIFSFNFLCLRQQSLMARFKLLRDYLKFLFFLINTRKNINFASQKNDWWILTKCQTVLPLYYGKELRTLYEWIYYFCVYISSKFFFISSWLVVCVLWHINLCRLFKAKFIFLQIISSNSNNSVEHEYTV